MNISARQEGQIEVFVLNSSRKRPK